MNLFDKYDISSEDVDIKNVIDITISDISSSIESFEIISNNNLNYFLYSSEDGEEKVQENTGVNSETKDTQKPETKKPGKVKAFFIKIWEKIKFVFWKIRDFFVWIGKKIAGLFKRDKKKIEVVKRTLEESKNKPKMEDEQLKKYIDISNNVQSEKNKNKIDGESKGKVFKTVKPVKKEFPKIDENEKVEPPKKDVKDEHNVVNNIDNNVVEEKYEFSHFNAYPNYVDISLMKKLDSEKANNTPLYKFIYARCHLHYTKLIGNYYEEAINALLYPMEDRCTIFRGHNLRSIALILLYNTTDDRLMKQLEEFVSWNGIGRVENFARSVENFLNGTVPLNNLRELHINVQVDNVNEYIKKILDGKVPEIKYHYDVSNKERELYEEYPHLYRFDNFLGQREEGSRVFQGDAYLNDTKRKSEEDIKKYDAFYKKTIAQMDEVFNVEVQRMANGAIGKVDDVKKHCLKYYSTVVRCLKAYTNLRNKQAQLEFESVDQIYKRCIVMKKVT